MQNTPSENKYPNGDSDILPTPPKRLKIEKTAQGMTITHRKFHLAALLMIIPIVFMGNFVWKLSLSGDSFFIPFLVVDLVLIAQILFLLFGKQIITLSPGNGHYFRGVGNIGITKHFSFNENTTCREQETVVRNSRSQSSYALIIKNPGEKTVTIGGFWDRDIPCYLEDLLNQLKK